MRQQRGQSMTELAMILPVLLLVFLGLVDVGRYMIAHQYAIGLSRDLARFGVRENVVDYYATDREGVGYWRIKDYLDEIMQPTIAHAYSLDSNVQIRISLLRYSTGPVFCLIDPCVDFLGVNGNTLSACRGGKDLHFADDEQSTPDDAILWLQTWGQDYSEVRPLDYQSLIDGMRTKTIDQGCRMEERAEQAETSMLEERTVTAEVVYQMDWWFIPFGEPVVYRSTQTRTGK